MFDISRSGLTLFSLEIHWYGILIALGVLGGVLIAYAREKKLGLPADTTLNLALVGVPAAIICARAYYVLFSWDYYAAHPEDILRIRQGGMAIYGGIIGGILAGYIYCRVKKINPLTCMDLAAPALALGQAVGRWGNFINQEAYGGAVENPALRFFPLAVKIPDSGWHYATFFYESLWCALIVAVIIVGEKKRLFKRRGDAFWAYLFLYALERTLVEGLRTDSLYLGPIRISQLLSLAALLALAMMELVRTRRAIGWLPVLITVLMGVSIALKCAYLPVILAILLLTVTAAIYIGKNSILLKRT